MIQTQRLTLLPTSIVILEKLLLSDKALAEHLGIQVAPNWATFGKEPYKYVVSKIQEEPTAENWWTYLPIVKAENIMIGSGGYKGLPTEDGIVEIGYEIAPAYREKGFATEMAKGLIQHAFQFPEVKLVIAHTLAEKNPSTSVLTKCGFEKTAEIFEAEEGQIWRWEMPRVRYLNQF